MSVAAYIMYAHTHTHTLSLSLSLTHTQGSKMSSQWRRALWRRGVGFALEMLSRGIFCLVLGLLLGLGIMV